MAEDSTTAAARIAAAAPGRPAPEPPELAEPQRPQRPQRSEDTRDDVREDESPVEDESTPEQPVVQRAGTPLVEQPGEEADERAD